MKRTLFVAVDVTDLTEDQTQALVAEMSAQTEASEDHPDAVFFAEYVLETDERPDLAGIVEVGAGL